MAVHKLAAIRNRCSGFSYCYVTATSCFINTTDMHYVVCLHLIEVIVAFLYSLSICLTICSRIRYTQAKLIINRHVL